MSDPTLISPLAPASFPDMPPIAGLRLAVGRAGLYPRERPDLVLFSCDAPATAAGVFTTNSVGSAPTDWCKTALAAHNQARALLVNAGCANSFTGPPGEAAARRCAHAVADALQGAPEEVLLASTGVIGRQLDADKVCAVVPDLARSLAPGGWEDAARAIMTTDTFPKGAAAVARFATGRSATVAGIAKGSGMIAPNMATMLAFVFTDAAVEPQFLRTLLADETETSFNSITVDGDRSTNDCVLAFALGGPGETPLREDDPRAPDFRAALSKVLKDLAIQIVRDGEGATKLVTVRVIGAHSDASAKRIARTICESPLVKTAIAGEDANWGRVVAAAGRADEPIARERLSVRFGPFWAARNGMIAPEYDEASLSTYFKRPELEMIVDVGVGWGEAVMHTCDLTKRYVEINGDYRS